MITAALSAALAFIKTPLGRALGLAAVAILILLLYGNHRASAAREKFLAEQLAAEQKESTRRNGVIEEAKRQSAALADELVASQSRSRVLLEEIARASAANDSRACLDPDAVRRLQSIGARHEADPRAGIGPR